MEAIKARRQQEIEQVPPPSSRSFDPPQRRARSCTAPLARFRGRLLRRRARSAVVASAQPSGRAMRWRAPRARVGRDQGEPPLALFRSRLLGT
jgi:hypothetical protein